jgi:hypothetical protein
MSRLRRLAAFAAALAFALAFALAGCGTAAEAPARPAVAASAPVLDAALTERAMAHAAQRLADAADRLDPQDGYPRSTGPDGRWQLRDAGSWTSGFFAGSLWLLYERTGDPVWRQRAQRWTVGLEAQKARTDTHDLGFMIFDSFGRQHQLTGDPHARDVTVEAARSLAARFNPADACRSPAGGEAAGQGLCAQFRAPTGQRGPATSPSSSHPGPRRGLSSAPAEPAPDGAGPAVVTGTADVPPPSALATIDIRPTAHATVVLQPVLQPLTGFPAAVTAGSMAV